MSLTRRLSHAYVAFTIELDDEFERRMPHRTAVEGRGRPDPARPWLMSSAMWWTCLRFLGPEGLTIAELEDRVGTATNVDGMRRWGFVSVSSGRGPLAKGPYRRTDRLRPTAAGLRAASISAELPTAIEARWRDAFGGTFEQARTAVAAADANLESGLPDCLPILGHGLWSRVTRPIGGPDSTAGGGHDLQPRPFQAGLARLLLWLALAYEHDAPTSLALAADLLAHLDPAIEPARLPVTAGVSREAIAVAISAARAMDQVSDEPPPAGARSKRIGLTPDGRRVLAGHSPRLTAAEAALRRRIGAGTFDELERALVALDRDAGAGPVLLTRIGQNPAGWRAHRSRPSNLPAFPMVLHRGGFPDGA